MQPPGSAPAGGALAEPEARQIRDHQGEDQPGDDARFRRDLTEPLGLYREPADEQARDRHRDGYGPHRDEREIEPAEAGFVRKKRRVETGGDVVDGDESEGAESPKHERVREPGRRPLADHLALQHHLPKEIADAPA